MSNKKWRISENSRNISFWYSTTEEGCPTPGKRTYETRKDARTVLRRVPKPLEEPKARRAVYHCLCGGWHIGSQIMATREAARDVAARKLEPPAAA